MGGVQEWFNWPVWEPRTSAEGWLSGSKRRSRKPFIRKGGTGSNPVPSALLRGKSHPPLQSRTRPRIAIASAVAQGEIQ